MTIIGLRQACGGALVIGAIAGLVAFAAPASAFVYWGYSNADGTGGIGRANNDGTGVIATFIPAASNVGGIAVSGRYIYWASGGANEVGRANIDGTHVDPDLITSADNPSGVAINSQYIYWSNYYGQSIGRANIDGSSPVENFITTARANPIGVSVDGPHLYWGYGPVKSYNADAVGRAKLDGTGQTSFLDTAPYLAGATTEAGSYLYWTEKTMSLAQTRSDARRSTARARATPSSPGLAIPRVPRLPVRRSSGATTHSLARERSASRISTARMSTRILCQLAAQCCGR